eukprot:SAG11_NODE_15378_length_580_cov_0.968815_1_plen_22_part_10
MRSNSDYFEPLPILNLNLVAKH